MCFSNAYTFQYLIGQGIGYTIITPLSVFEGIPYAYSLFLTIGLREKGNTHQRTTIAMMNEYNMYQPHFIYLTYGTLDASSFCISLNTYLSTFYFCSSAHVL
jgi:hypothetical protein